MSLSATKQQNKNPPIKMNKNIEINMSTLSTAQKQMCLKLLAQSNVNFQEAKQKNCFQAELKIDPIKFTSQFNAQKQPEPNLSPIKNRQPLASRKSNTKPKQNQPNSSNITFNHNHKQKKKPQTLTKQPPNPIYTNSKKSLSKTIKLNALTQLQTIYPFVELYVYPKKMPFHSLVELIEEIYELYWNIQINKQKHKHKAPQKEFSFDNKSSTLHEHPTKAYKHSQQKQKSIYLQEKQTLSKAEIKQQEKKTFCNWVFEHFILSQKEKMKIEQFLVNFVESLNHFSYKHLGIQMFYNFLAGTYNLQTLNYFLVIRALLEQIEGEKIIQKVSSYGSKAGVLYKMKLNPYNKLIAEEKVIEFLEVCCQSSTNQSRQDETINKVFQEMTQQMFFDEKKKKNYINFFEMVEFLLREFLKVQTVNTTNLQLSYTQDNQEMNDFMLQEQLYTIMSPDGKIDQDLELTFEVHQEEEGQQEANKHYYIQQQSDGDLNEYLPNYYSRELEMQPKKQDRRQNFEHLLYEELCRKYETIRRSFSRSAQSDSSNLVSKQILETLFTSVVKGDKKKWSQLMASKKVTIERQSQELHFIQRLQIQFDRIKNSNIVSNEFIRKILTVPYLREAIVHQAGVSFVRF